MDRRRRSDEEQDHQHDTADDQAERPVEPRRDHSERPDGGDQDVDTAGMIPGNKATDSKDPTGF
jgi:hypothetical protein